VAGPDRAKIDPISCPGLRKAGFHGLKNPKLCHHLILTANSDEFCKRLDIQFTCIFTQGILREAVLRDAGGKG